MEAIFSIFVVVVEFVFHAIAWAVVRVCRSVTYLIASGDRSLAPEERRRLRRESLVGLGLVAGLVALFMAYDGWMKRQGRIARQVAEATAAAERQIVAVADRLDRRRGPQDRYVRRPSPLPDVDPWGRPLRVVYLDRDAGERLVVSSLGADGKFGTSDDLTEIRSNVRQPAAAAAIGNPLWGAARGRLASDGEE